MSDSPSPVHASAQEPVSYEKMAHRFVRVHIDDSAGWPDAERDLIAALTAAEARGRQQAEQARDEALATLKDPEKWMKWCDHRVLERAEAAESRVAALTQALKDYGQHKPDCMGDLYSSKFGTSCTCGLEVALTGAQVTV